MKFGPNYFRSKFLAVSWGYFISADCPFSFCVALGPRPTPPDMPNIVWSKYRVTFGAYWDWPKFMWLDERWVLNEAGYVHGMPVARQGVASSAWTGRRYHLRYAGWYRGWWFTRHD